MEAVRHRSPAARCPKPPDSRRLAHRRRRAPPSYGHGWVQGAGHGVMTVRFETRASGPGACAHLRRDTPAVDARQPGRQPGLAGVRRRAWPSGSAPAGDDVATGEPLASAAISSTRACGGAQSRHHHRAGVDQFAARSVARGDPTRRAPSSTPPPRPRRRNAARTARRSRRRRCPSPAPPARFRAHRRRRTRPSPTASPPGYTATMSTRGARSPTRAEKRPPLRRRWPNSPSAPVTVSVPAKPMRSAVATFCEPSGCQHRAREAHQHAESAGRRAGRHRQRVAQIGAARRRRARRRCAARRSAPRVRRRRRSGPATARSPPWCRCRG